MCQKQKQCKKTNTKPGIRSLHILKPREINILKGGWPLFVGDLNSILSKSYYMVSCCLA